jgi:putative lipoic acid-binding regulatory protein
MEREVALELLRSQHEFPGPFQFRVIVRPEASGSVIDAMTASAGETARVREVTRRLSSKGTYVALHIDMEVPSAESVLDVYAVLHGLTGVMTAL